MKTLALKIAADPRYSDDIAVFTPHGAPLNSTALRYAGFELEFVTLVTTAALAPLLAREAYRVHCVEKLAKRMCGCTVTYLGDPAPSGDCPDGVRLAAAVTSAKKEDGT